MQFCAFLSYGSLEENSVDFALRSDLFSTFSKAILTNTCSTVTPGQPLNDWQQLGLNLVSFWQGRDVILAIDLTESVGLNDEGRIRLRQIVKDSLQKGDRVYVVPFATEVYDANSIIEFREKEDIDKVLDIIPFQADSTLQNTDIQKAEAYIYPKLAGINQCRLLENKSIRPQSVVWLTDAPLLTSPGIDSETWIETPTNSPFRNANSPESQQRESWLEALQRHAPAFGGILKRSRSITTEDNRQYSLTVVDIKPTVQEFCTPAPGGRETCLVTPYLVRQLWLPSLIVGLGIIGGAVLLFTLMSWRKKWQLIIHREEVLKSHLAEVVNVEKDTQGYSTVTVAFPEVNVENDLSSLLTMIFGKYSMAGVGKFVGVRLPQTYAMSPQFGVRGIRERLQVYDRPLIMAIFKPALGLSATDHAAILEQVATVGLDIIKDDEILGDLAVAPTLQRLEACSRVLETVMLFSMQERELWIIPKVQQPE